MPFGQLFQCPHPPTHAGPVACRPSPLGFAACASLPCVRSSAADAASFLSPVAFACRRRDSAAGSLDAPRFAPTLAYASGIPPALHWVIFVFLSCVLLFLSVRYSKSQCALRLLASLLPPDGVTTAHLKLHRNRAETERLDAGRKRTSLGARVRLQIRATTGCLNAHPKTITNKDSETRD
jgi:hypothetical protein